MNNRAFWQEFQATFKSAVEAQSAERIGEIWDTSRGRTQFYENEVLEVVATELGMVLKLEDFKIDYTLCRESEQGERVPLVYVESENVALSAVHEVRKLCCLHAPLKVLITCSEWKPQPEHWVHGGQEELLLDRWSGVIRAFHEVVPQECLYGVIVGERAGAILRFYSVTVAGSGAIEKRELLSQRAIG